MDQRVSLVTLGVRDLKNARAFYEALGWTTGAGPHDEVVFFQAGCMVFALWDRALLAEDSVLHVIDMATWWTWLPITLTYDASLVMPSRLEGAEISNPRMST